MPGSIAVLEELAHDLGRHDAGIGLDREEEDPIAPRAGLGRAQPLASELGNDGPDRNGAAFRQSPSGVENIVIQNESRAHEPRVPQLMLDVKHQMHPPQGSGSRIAGRGMAWRGGEAGGGCQPLS